MISSRHNQDSTPDATPHTADAAGLSAPSFSIVIETENLATGDFDDLRACLDSLSHQDIPIERAREVIVLDAGHVDADQLDVLTDRYPWVQFHIHPEPLTYYQSKLLAPRLVTGDVVVLADSDMVYEPAWLGSLLAAFGHDPRIRLVGGVTRVQPGGVYRLAMSLAWMLPMRRTRGDVSDTAGFFANNVALRRDLFDRVPFPHERPLYRRQSEVYAQMLRDNGIRLVRQHAARGYHRPPERVGEWVMRMLVLGNDMAYISTLRKDSANVERYDFQPARWNMALSLVGSLRKRIRQVNHGILIFAKEAPAQLLRLPLALPMVAVCLALQLTGGLITLMKPGIVLHWTRHFEDMHTRATPENAP